MLAIQGGKRVDRQKTLDHQSSRGLGNQQKRNLDRAQSESHEYG